MSYGYVYNPSVDFGDVGVCVRFRASDIIDDYGYVYNPSVESHWISVILIHLK